jgi:hypothetical protein
MYQQKKNVRGIKDAASSASQLIVVVDISDIVIISGITNMVKAITSGITNTPQKT